jgi:magnesium chelatase subunit D
MAPVRYPLSAVLGNDDLVLALVLNAVSPAIGGVLARGEKGTAKSTAVRALTAVLPDLTVVQGCRFSCDPAAPDPSCPDGPHAEVVAVVRRAHLAELPVGATEDRLTGSLDLERALTDGVRAYEPGLLAAAHRGVLYVDEVNLLHDHLVDLLLDAAALGVSYVERDGVSVQHAARFLLVGTMNPEEGELRPQLLDRFGLSVEVTAPRDVASRAEVVRRRLAYDRSPAEFVARYAPDEAGLSARIAQARERLDAVVLTDSGLEKIAAVCAAFEVDGLRADIVTARTAMAHAAWVGRDAVTAEDVRVAARLALPHRRRRNPFDAPGLDEQQLEDALGPQDPADPPPDGPEGGAPPSGGPGADSADAGGDQTQDTAEPTGPDGEPGRSAPTPGSAAPAVASGAAFATRRLEVAGLGAGAAGRRSRAVTDTGLTVRSQRPEQPLRRLHLVGTVTAAAPWQRERGRRGPLLLRREDLREAVREGREANLVLFAVDASGSMAARSRMGAVKGAVLSLLLDAYQRRDKVGMLAFRGGDAELLLPPTSSVEAAARRLEVLPTGGRTPLTAGLLLAHQTLGRERMRDPRRRPLLVVVTDGRHTSGEHPARVAAALAGQGVASVVVDCESGPVRLGMALSLAEHLGAEYLRLEDLAAAPLASLVRQRRAG